MKYLRKFENDDKEPKFKVGDYTICIDRNFEEIKNYIGVITNYKNGFYYIKYDYDKLSEDLSEGFRTYGELGIRPFTDDEILYSSSNEEELESILMANKYNL